MPFARRSRHWRPWATGFATFVRMMPTAPCGTPSPCSKSPQLRPFDYLLRSLLGEIANISIMDDDRAWMQASLPVGSGGLGVRSATQLAPSAFLASAAGCTYIIHELLPPRLRKTAYHAQEDTLQVWSEGLDASTPPALDAPRQKAWMPLKWRPLSRHYRRQHQTYPPRLVSWRPARKRREHGCRLFQFHPWACAWKTMSSVWPQDYAWVCHCVNHTIASSARHQWIVEEPTACTDIRVWDAILTIQQ